jgi:hypothetical protein
MPAGTVLTDITAEAKSLLDVTNLVVGYYQTKVPQHKGGSYGSWEDLLASLIDKWSTVCARSALEVGGKTYIIECPLPTTHAKSVVFLQQVIEDLKKRRHILQQQTAAGNGETLFESVRAQHYHFVDAIKHRVGYVECPTCRFRHGFWQNSEKKEECPVCLESTTGCIAPCSHALCCFNKLKRVPITTAESMVPVFAEHPLYKEWAKYYNTEEHQARVGRSKALQIYLTQRKLCQNCVSPFEKMLEAEYRCPLFNIESFFIQSDSKARSEFIVYVGKLLKCTKRNHHQHQ